MRDARDMQIDWQVVLLAFIAAMFAAIPPTIAAWRTGNINKESSDKAMLATNQVADTLATSTSDTTAKLTEIHVLVNSRLTETLKKIDSLEGKLYAATGETPSGEPPQAPPTAVA
jgi:hypothetical protein